MRHHMRPIAALFLIALLATSIAAAEPKSPLARLDLRDGDTMVFLGDSITHQCLYTQYVEDYFYTHFPDRRIRFHNSGVGGDRARDCLIRFDRDVAHYKPKYVSVLIGMNDGTYRPYDDATFQTYRKDMRELIGRIEEIGATPILIHPTMYDSVAARENRPNSPPERLELYNAVLAYYGAWLRELAYQSGYGYVDMYSPLNSLTLTARKTDAQFTMIRDAVHPNPPGQLIMAHALLRDMEAPRRLSRIEIFRTSKGEAESQARRGKLTGVRFTSDGVEFNFHAKGLPMPVLAEAKIGAELANLPHRLGQQSIEIHGLEPGNYQLLIDDQPAGTYTAAQLGHHVNLEDNEKTPDYQQAQQVAQLNKRRTDEAVRPLRNLWGAKKRLRISLAQLEQNPDNEDIKKRVADLEKVLENFEEKIANLEAKAKSIEDEIFQINQPQPHHYRIVRVQ